MNGMNGKDFYSLADIVEQYDIIRDMTSQLDDMNKVLNRRLLQLHETGVSYGEIGKALGSSRGGVAARVERARQERGDSTP